MSPRTSMIFLTYVLTQSQLIANNVYTNLYTPWTSKKSVKTAMAFQKTMKVVAEVQNVAADVNDFLTYRLKNHLYLLSPSYSL